MSEIVFSTDPEWDNKCTNCGNNQSNCTCVNKGSGTSASQTAFILREKKGRRGKTVTVISNLKGDLKSLQRDLQKKCASGGALKNGAIEIQGDHLDKIKLVLHEKGFGVKQIGG